jgi:hypothetical protein
MPMPGSEGRPLYSGGQETLNLGLTDRPTRPESSGSTLPARPASDQSTTPHVTTVTADGPSWLAAPMSTGRTDPALDRSAAVDDSLISRSEAPTLEQPVFGGRDEDTVTCSRCGSEELSSAAFCTQCGNRLKAT